ncbi:ribonuclease III [Pelagibacteraceae bacterium]|jgi:ribonuclease III|nr:ribonuclease III [Pelagibacteraceae bacterium]|tara:strand:+ start:746 stop:1414 length:669 start_codon:yes stop_codon:yes gene_type:complete
MKNSNKDLEIILDYKFKNSTLLKQALIHKSFDNDNNNEKLEFLGDRVLGLVISKKLIEIYPEEKEGIIDKKFANLVNKKTCSNIAKKINFKKFMLLGASHKSLLRSADKIMSDCLEALIGAIYLDGGLKSAEKFILNFWKKYLDNSVLPFIDAKTQLQEHSLKQFKELPKYTFYKVTGPQHSPLFKTDVQIPFSKKTIGTGSSKKNAQQSAANRLLKSLKIL